MKIALVCEIGRGFAMQLPQNERESTIVDQF